MNNNIHKIPDLFDSKGGLLKAHQICICTSGSIVNKPYKVRLINSFKNNLYFKGKKVKTPYLCTELISGEGYKAVIWPNWSTRLSIIKNAG